VHLLDTIRYQFFELGDDDGSDTLDELLHFVQTLLLIVHVHLLQLGNQIVQDVLFLVLESTDHNLTIDDLSQDLLSLCTSQLLLGLGSLLLVIKETNKGSLVLKIKRVDNFLEVLLNHMQPLNQEIEKYFEKIINPLDLQDKRSLIGFLDYQKKRPKTQKKLTSAQR
jgi:hypothetical protein